LGWSSLHSLSSVCYRPLLCLLTAIADAPETVIIKVFADRDERRERAAAGAPPDEEASTDEKISHEDMKEKDTGIGVHVE
jgi:hypothetical protein